MKPGAPWSIKGVDPATREAAKAAAAAAGMSLGQWLNHMVREAQKAPAAAPKAAPPPAAGPASPAPPGPPAPGQPAASPGAGAGASAGEWQAAARDLAIRLQETERRIAAVVVPLRQQVGTLQAKIQSLETELAGLRALPPGPPADPAPPEEPVRAGPPPRPEPPRPDPFVLPAEPVRADPVAEAPAGRDPVEPPPVAAPPRPETTPLTPGDGATPRPAPLPPDADILDALTRRPGEASGPAATDRARPAGFRPPPDDGAFEGDEQRTGPRQALVIAVIMLVALTMAGLGWYGLREVAPNAGADLLKLLRGQPVPPPPLPPTSPNQAQGPASQGPAGQGAANQSPATQTPASQAPAVQGAVAEALPRPTPGPAAAPPAVAPVAPPANDALRALLDAARTGEPRAQFNLGVAYYRGEGTARDFTEAGRWFERAAKQNLADAQFALASMFEKGEGMTADPAMAILWYEAAANQNYVPAMFNIGTLYAQGKGAAQDYMQAAKWFERAAAFGLPNALVNLAIIAEGGYGRPASDREAYRWYALAVKQGDTQSEGKKRALAQRLPPADVAAIDREVAAWRPRPVVPGPRGALPAPEPVAPQTAASPPTGPPAGGLDRDGLARLQALLGRLGYDVGTPDGLMGERTRRAIQDYQRSMGLPVDGLATRRLLEQVEGGGRARS